MRDGPGILSRRDPRAYFAMRMALIRAERDNTVAMRMLADLAAWNAVTQQRTRTYR